MNCDQHKIDLLKYLNKMSKTLNNQDAHATNAPLYILMKKRCIIGVSKLVYPKAEKRFFKFFEFSDSYDLSEKGVSEKELDKMNIRSHVYFDEDNKEVVSNDAFIDDDTNAMYKEIYIVKEAGRNGQFIDVFITEDACKKALEKERRDTRSEDDTYYMYVSSAYKNSEMKALQGLLKDDHLTKVVNKGLLRDAMTNNNNSFKL